MRKIKNIFFEIIHICEVHHLDLISNVQKYSTGVQGEHLGQMEEEKDDNRKCTKTKLVLNNQKHRPRGQDVL